MSSIFLVLSARSIVLAALLFMGASPIAAAECAVHSHLSKLASDSYQNIIEFDVVRNDKVVGRHLTTFSRSPAGLQVRSDMQLSVKIFFVTVFEFQYHSLSIWCGEELMRLVASVDRNGSKNSFTAVFDGKNTALVDRDTTTLQPGSLIPTNHWNPEVLNHDLVLNTLTGKVNAVEIKGCPARRALEVGLSMPAEAACYEYSGDLSATVWYLGERWIGLLFEGDDGSQIVYRCKACGPS